MGFTAWLVFVLSWPSALSAEEIRVAVASNFKTTLEKLAEDFESRSEHRLIVATGSTGKHFAQIVHGAPFDIFLAADTRRPRLLEQRELSVLGSRYTYAIGKLVLWSPQPDVVDGQSKILQQGNYRRLAMANPRLAPYGRAAKEVLQYLGLYHKLSNKIVRGENIAQTYQFVATGNAELGFVARSQIHRPGKSVEGSYWEIPAKLYKSIEQQLVLLTDSPATQEFLAYIKSDFAHTIIQSFGYATIENEKP